MNVPVLTANVQGLVSRGKLTRDKAEKALSMLKGVTDYSEFNDVDMVIEVGSLNLTITEFKLYKISTNVIVAILSSNE